MATPPSNDAQMSCHDDVEVASDPSVPRDGVVANGSQDNEGGNVSHDSGYQNDNEAMAAVSILTGMSPVRGNAHEGNSFLMMMQKMLQGTKSFDSASVVSGSEPVVPMPRSMRNHHGQSYNTLDSAGSKTPENFSDERNCQNWDGENPGKSQPRMT